MPLGLKKYFRELKSEVSEHLWLAKNKNRLLSRRKVAACEKPPVIRNDLRRPNKNEKNSYRDYSTHCDEVLFYQNNCALRCSREPKLQNDVAAEERARGKSASCVCSGQNATECTVNNCEPNFQIDLT